MSLAAGEISLQKIHVICWFYLLAICLASCLYGAWQFAWSALAGGVVSVLSFTAAQRDVLAFIGPLAGEDEGTDSARRLIKQGKTGFLIKFWLRLLVIGIILLVLIKYLRVNIFGLILGLSTVVLAITHTAFGMVFSYLIKRR